MDISNNFEIMISNITNKSGFAFFMVPKSSYFEHKFRIQFEQALTFSSTFSF